MSTDARKIRLIMELRRSGITDTRVLSAIERIRRDLFVPEAFRDQAYENIALPIELGQTISQPLVVALMTQELAVGERMKVLEIGTGSGYQAAVLAALVPELFTVERIEELLRQARRRFRQLGITNLRSKHDDGKLGWSDEAPFDAIILTAAGDTIPTRILDQLTPTGVLVAPVGSASSQTLIRMRGDGDGDFIQEELGPVSFVPLLGGIG